MAHTLPNNTFVGLPLWRRRDHLPSVCRHGQKRRLSHPSKGKDALIQSGKPITDTKMAITKPHTYLTVTIEQATRGGEALILSNAAGSSLEVSYIIAPVCVTLTPQPPFSIESGQSIGICIEVDCSVCLVAEPNTQFLIMSNDPDDSSSRTASL